MKFLRFATVVLAAVATAAVFLVAAPGSASAQLAEDYYVSCIKCHALPEQQALGQMADHGVGYPPVPEQACTYCHDTFFHEQYPGALPPQRYFWPGPNYGPDSFLTNLCTACHPGHTHELNPVPALEGMPYFDGTINAMLAAPTSVLPLFDQFGQANQNPYVGGMVCSTCHDPHEPSYPYGSNNQPKFLRIGSPGYAGPLCNACHDPAPPSGAAADLVIPSRSNSVVFSAAPYGQQQIFVTVKNRGNARSYNENAGILWVDAMGAALPIGSFPIPPLEPEQEWGSTFVWMPPPHWSAGEGYYLFSLPPSALLPTTPRVFVRATYQPPAPTNLHVMFAGAGTVALAWDAPPTGPFMFDVYRDGQLLARSTSPYYHDNGIAPETPHVYTVKSVTPDEISSEPSDAVGATTTGGFVVRVPQDYPTIQEAIWYANPGTSIHVAAGTYTEPFSFYGKEGITVRGQDANGCVLDLPYSGDIDLGQSMFPPFGPTGNTLAGFTIRGDVRIRLSIGDVLAGCVIGNDSGARVIAAGGLAAHCIFDTYAPAVEIQDGAFFAAVNSIFFSPMPLYHSGPPATAAQLLNNGFYGWFQYTEYQGSGNFGDYPAFQPPGPPYSYFTLPYSATTDRGFWLGAPCNGLPDVGVFETGFFYTPMPPFNLTATAQGGQYPAVVLGWSNTPGLIAGGMHYNIYRASDPTFPPGSEYTPYATIPAGGMTMFTDGGVTPGVTYYYQVRASAGPANPPWQGELLSTPTNTATATVIANRPPTPIDDAVQTPEDQAATIAVLANDADPDADPLFPVYVDQPMHGTASANPDGTVRYVPAADYAGSDQFAYTVTDGRGEYATALVVVEVTPVNDLPVAANDVYTANEDAPLVVSSPGLLANDNEIDGPLFDAIVETFPGHGVLQQGPGGAFTYNPHPDFHGTDTFTYRAFDGVGFSSIALVTIAVRPVNDRPLPIGQGVLTAEDTAVAVTLQADDVDGDALTYAVVAAPAHGTLSGTAPNLTYTPSANYHGPDTFSFTASDGQLTSVPGVVAVTVTPVNDQPSADAGPNQSGATGQTLAFSGAASFDPDGAITGYSWDWGDNTAAGAGVTATHAYAAPGTYTVTLTVTDDGGATATDSAAVTVAAGNLALMKIATASTTRSGYLPANAVDGSGATSWMSSKTGSTQWLRVDLGASKSISNVKVSWKSGYHAKSFKVETSTNGTSWTTRSSTTSGAGGLTNVTFGPASARYVRVSCTKAYSSSYYGILELEVYQ